MLDRILEFFVQNPLIAFSLIAILFGLWMLDVSLRTHKKEQRLKAFNLDSSRRNEEDKKKFIETMVEFFDQTFSSDPREVTRKFAAAGFYHPNWAKFYIPVKYVVLISGGVVIAFYDYTTFKGLSSIIIHIAIWLVAIIMLPDAYLSVKAKRMTRTISGRLPYLLDLMAVCVQTGMTIEAAIRYLSKEMEAFDKDIAVLLTRVNDRSNIVGLPVALEELYHRVPSNEMRSFVMTLNQSLHYGSSIYSVLSTLSADIREVQLLTIEEKIGKLAAKMSVPLILFIMMPIVILVAAPGVMRMLANV